MAMKIKTRKMIARYIKDENRVAAQARNFMNFPQPSRTNIMKEPIGFPMMPYKVNGRVACFIDVRKGNVIRLRYETDEALNLEDDKEYVVEYKGRTLISAQQIEVTNNGKEN